MKIRQSLCYPIFQTAGVTVEALFQEAARTGYAAVELWFRGSDFTDVAALARKHKLAIASMCGHGTLTDGLNKRANHDRIERELRESIDVAVQYGVPGVICLSGNCQPGQSAADAFEVIADGLRRVAPYAEKKGVNLNLELLNSKVDHPGYQCDHTAYGVAICERVNSPRVKLLYDIYHMQIMEGDVIRTLQENIRWIGHFHTAGNPGRHEMNNTQELNYAGICRAIAATGYNLYVGHELAPTGDPRQAVRETFAICDQG